MLENISLDPGAGSASDGNVATTGADSSVSNPSEGAAQAGATAPVDTANFNQPLNVEQAAQPQNQQNQQAPGENADGQDDWETTRAEALKQAENEFTPKWYRETLRKYEGKFGELNQRIEQFGQQQAAPPSVPDETLKLYEGAKDFQLRFSQIPASQEEAKQFALDRLKDIEQVNPYLAEEMGNELFWRHTVDDRGQVKPEAVQGLLDTILGEPGKVSADVLLGIVNQLADGTLKPDDLEWNITPEQKAINEERRALAAEKKQYTERFDTEMKRREVEVRTAATQGVTAKIADQFRTGIVSHLTSLNLMPTANDTPDVAEFKRDISANLTSYIKQLEAENPDLQYIHQRIEILNKPTKSDTEKERLAIEQTANSLDFQDRVNRGLKEINDKAREYINRQAANYNRWLRGGPASTIANNVQNARQEPNAPGWKIPNTPNGQGNGQQLSAVDAGALALENARRSGNGNPIG